MAMKAPGGAKDKKPIAFIISPIGDEQSETRKHADNVLKKIIRPALREAQIRAKRSDDFDVHGNIHDHIMEQLGSSRLCIGVLTNLNPNVLIEIGIRLAWNLPILLVAKAGTPLPFDILAQFTVFYDLETKNGDKKAQSSLARRAKLLLQRPEGMLSAGSIALKKGLEELGHRQVIAALFHAKQKIVESFVEGMQKVLRELENDFERGKTAVRALEEFARMVESEFEELEQKENVIRLILKIPRAPRHFHSGCSQLLNRIHRLYRRGTALRSFLKSASASKANFRKAESKIRRIISDAESIVSSIVDDVIYPKH